MRYLIAYDIADPKRLQRISRRLERVAIRWQKSVFIFVGNQTKLTRLLDELMLVMNSSQDIVQAWKLSPDQSDFGQYLGQLISIEPEAIICSPTKTNLIDSEN